MTGPRVLVCGGRDFNARGFAFACLDVHASNASVLIHGAAKGADTLGGDWARNCGIPVETYPVDWSAHGRSAGPIRNAKMLAEGKRGEMHMREGGQAMSRRLGEMDDVMRDEIGMMVARDEQEKSTRPVKVGASILSRMGFVNGHGFNALPERLSDAPGPYSRTVHAEIEAILSANVYLHGRTIYVTCPVCHHCAPIVIHAGITRVVTLPPPDGLADWYEASFAAARAMFAEAGVECVEISDV